jgi:hypothetical protein
MVSEDFMAKEAPGMRHDDGSSTYKPADNEESKRHEEYSYPPITAPHITVLDADRTLHRAKESDVSGLFLTAYYGMSQAKHYKVSKCAVMCVYLTECARYIIEMCDLPTGDCRW